MKLDLLFETDEELRRLERASQHDPMARQAYHHHLKRSGQVNPIPEDLKNSPDALLKFYHKHFNGKRWPELEEHLLNSKQVESLRRGRVGDMTFPTLTIVKYALQLNEYWPEFLDIAKLMLNFIVPPAGSHIGTAGRGGRMSRPGVNNFYNKLGGSYRQPLCVGRISSGLILIAKYLIKHNLTPEWAGKLYEILLYALNIALANHEEYEEPETGLINVRYIIDNQLLGDPPHGMSIPFARSLGSEEDLSRVVNGLKQLLGN